MSRTDARLAAEAYRSVDRATRVEAREPLWLPAGWLAVVLMLAAAAPSFGAPASGDGWRARGTSAATRTTRAVKPRPSAIRQVAYEDDIAGPALKTAGRMRHNTFYDGEYRVAQQDAGDAFGDSLRESFERPFGMGDETGRPANDNSIDADDADRLFDDLPEEETTLPEPEEPTTTFDEPAYDEPTTDSQYERQPGSLFDDEPTTTPEVVAPGPPAEFSEPAVENDPLAKERAMVRDKCAEELANLKGKGLDTIDLFIGVTGDEGTDYPYICSLDDGSVFVPRQWCEITYMWKASGLCHKPLYFEDVHLERYGHSWGPYVQPLVSGAHFFGTIPILPYKMGLKTPNECVYALGHYRPGDCAPYLIDPIPFTWRAAFYQAGATVGAAAILP